MDGIRFEIIDNAGFDTAKNKLIKRMAVGKLLYQWAIYTRIGREKIETIIKLLKDYLRDTFRRHVKCI